MGEHELWNSTRYWREINYIFYHLVDKKLIKPLSGNKKGSDIKTFSDDEKQKHIELFTERLLTKSNILESSNLLNKLNVPLPHSTIIDRELAKNILIDLYKYNVVNNRHTDWIDRSNEQQINYLWSYLTMAHVIDDTKTLYLPRFFHLKDDNLKSPNAIPYYPLDRNFTRNTLPYRELKLNRTPTDTCDKYKNIIKFIDLWQVDLYTKERQLKILEDMWLSIKNKNKMISWLEQNNDLCEWSWGYIKSNFLNNKTPYWVADLDNIDDKYNKNSEIIKTLINLYNLIEDLPAKALLMTNLSRAASQYRYREKNKYHNKQNINIVISDESKLNFDKIKNHFNLNSEQTLERLIDLALDSLDSKNKMKLF